MGISTIKGSSTIGSTEWSLTNGANGSSSLTANAGPSRLSLTVDANATAAGDQFRALLYAKANAGTQRLVQSFDVAGAVGGEWALQFDGMYEGWEITLKKVAGTDRSLPWTIVAEDSSTSNVTAWNGTAPSNLNGGNVPADVTWWRGSTPNSLQFGRVDSYLGATASAVIGAASFAADAITRSVVATDAIGAAQIASDAATEIAAAAASAVWATVLEGTMTAAQVARGILGFVGGVASGFTGSTLTFKSVDGTKTRWTVATSPDGRTTVTPGDLS